MSTPDAASPPTRLQVRATVSVNGRPWRCLTSTAALATAKKDAHVFALDPESGAVRFGDGLHGAQPPAGSRVRVAYGQGSAGAAQVGVTWTAHWPPPEFALAAALAPRTLTDPCG